MNRSCLLIMVILAFGTNSYATAEWKLAKDESDIKVYTRKNPRSDFDEYRGITSTIAPLNQIVKLIQDVKNLSSWIDTYKKSTILERYSKDEYLSYSVCGAPWPVSDRDSVIRTTLQRDVQSGEVHIKMVGKPNAYPKQDGLVRIKMLESFWKLTPLPNDRVKIHYQVLTDPGGSLPAWLVNSIIIDQPFNTLTAMKKKLESSK